MAEKPRLKLEALCRERRLAALNTGEVVSFSMMLDADGCYTTDPFKAEEVFAHTAEGRDIEIFIGGISGLMH